MSEQGSVAAHIEKLRARLREKPALHFIAGDFTDAGSEDSFVTLNPATNEPLAEVARGGEPQVAQAAAAASKAFPRWRALSAKERGRLMLAIAERLVAKTEELSTVECLDSGQVLRIVRAQVARAAENFSFYAEYAQRLFEGHTYPMDDRFLFYTVREPVGPVGIITPWNAPLMLATWRVAPALVAGNTVILKPAEWAPLTANLLAEAIAEAGVPPGVFNVVHGFGEEAGAALVSHPQVPLITLTGETTTGKTVMANAAQHLKKLSLELGGKSPAILFADAELEAALDAIVFQIFSFNGERCTANSRLLVERPILDRVLQEVTRRARNLRLGDPLDPATELGPLIHPEHLERVLRYVAIGQEEGAQLLCGGRRWGERGNFMEATVFFGNNAMRIAQEEIFGPVLVVIPFDTEEQAVQLANDSSYGLAAYVFTSNLERGHRVARKLETGMVWLGSHNVRHLPTPFGGVKGSGTHREGGLYAFDFYTEWKCIAVPLQRVQAPPMGKEGP
jgi:5-carboxymethyl-2-hydroxymuconic-semialdehyde dehydrogenase